MHRQQFMPGRRDIIVIGASAGGVPAINNILAGLSGDFDGSIFIVLHLSPNTPSSIDRVLALSTDLPVSVASDRAPFSRRHVYVAAPDHHLILEAGCMRSIRGPKENWFRPSVDVLFRSAAYTYGPRTIAVVLSGMLEDGAAGLHAVKTRGGLTVVQDPGEARFSTMPEAALRTTSVDATLPSLEIAEYLMKESQKDAPSADDFPISRDLEIEVRIAKQELSSKELLEAVESLGTRTTMTCPECHGTLWVIEEDGQERFRCHVGHAYSVEALSSGQSTLVEEAMWSATRALEEKAMLSRRLADRLRSRGIMRGASTHDENAQRLERQAKLLREVIMQSRAPDPALVDDGR